MRSPRVTCRRLASLNVADKVVADLAITKGATVEEVMTQVVGINELPSWLQTADKAREFLTEMQLIGRSMGRFYTSFSGFAGTTADPKFTFVNGNATIDGGAGLLIVTGNLVLNGNPTFSGVILVLGEGTVNREGGGNGNVLGSIYVAKFARSWPAAENGLPHPFLAPRSTPAAAVPLTSSTTPSGCKQRKTLSATSSRTCANISLGQSI